MTIRLRNIFEAVLVIYLIGIGLALVATGVSALGDLIWSAIQNSHPLLFVGVALSFASGLVYITVRVAKDSD